MNLINSSRSRPELAKRNNHTDIFNAKQSDPVVIRNNEPVKSTNIFQLKSDEAYKRYLQSLYQPVQKKLNRQIENQKYTFDAQWSNRQFQSSKTAVNQNANFDKDYHHQRRYQELASSIFIQDPQSSRGPKQYRKVQQQQQKTLHPNKSSTFGRVSTIQREFDSQNSVEKKLIPNYSNLFGINERNVKSHQNLNRVDLIPNLMKWEQCDSILFNKQNKDQQVKADYHKKRYYQNMKSSMDTYQIQPNLEVQKSLQTANLAVQTNAQDKVMPVNEPVILNANIKTRPQSANKNSSSPKIEIHILKGLTPKFNLASLAQQCKLHSVHLVQFNNDTIIEKNGKGSLLVIPQKKYGLQNLCLWLKNQGLTVRLK